MKIHVEAYGRHARLLPQPHVTLDLPEGATLKQLLGHFDLDISSLSKNEGDLVVLINEAPVHDFDRGLSSGDKVKIFHLVSGG